MDGVQRIEQTSDTMTHWVTKIGGVEREFDAKITEQHPDERVAWTSVGEPKQAGVVTFHDHDRTGLHRASVVPQTGRRLGCLAREFVGKIGRGNTRDNSDARSVRARATRRNSDGTKDGSRM